MRVDAIEVARDRLLALPGGAAGWGYRPGSAPAVEPTALAGLALLAVAGNRPTGPGPDRARRAADWLAGLQRPDGSLGVSADLPEPGWPTPYALLLWAAIGGYEAERARGVGWLLGQRGLAVPPDGEGLVGHDSTLVGWPWVPETHSWIEPTAWAVLALCREGLARHPRTAEGLRLIRDRAIAGGGWNYGNSRVFGRPLRPQPATTGLALLALAGAGGPSEVVGPAIRYLEGALPAIRSAPSLGWGLLALRVWGYRPDRADAWLAEACAPAPHRPDSAPRIAPLLLAAAAGTAALLGLHEINRPIGAPA